MLPGTDMNRFEVATSIYLLTLNLILFVLKENVSFLWDACGCSQQECLSPKDRGVDSETLYVQCMMPVLEESEKTKEYPQTKCALLRKPNLTTYIVLLYIICTYQIIGM